MKPPTSGCKIRSRLGQQHRMGLPLDRMTCGKMAGQIIEPIPLSCALSEFCDDAQSDWVAPNTGQMLT